MLQQKRASFNAGLIWGVVVTLGIQGSVYWVLSAFVG